MTNRKRTLQGALTAAALALIALPGAAWAGAGDAGGGQRAPEPGQDPREVGVDPDLRVTAQRNVLLGRAVSVRGRSPVAHRRVRIDRRARGGQWVPVATTTAGGSGSFKVVWKPRAPGRYSLRAMPVTASGSGLAGAVRPSPPRPVMVYRPARATWYGPGFFGSRTACGQTLTKRTLGVAHRRLPCGTEVALSLGGRSVVVPVIDRGPYANGADWDLTQATAQRIGMTSTQRIGVLTLR